MEVSTILQYAIPLVTAATGWFLQSFLKLRQEFGEHRSGYGHKTFVDYTNDEFKVLRESIAKLETTTSVNLAKIEGLNDKLKEVARGSKYRFQISDSRVDLLEEVMRREGYLLFEKRQKETLPSKDTLDLDDEPE